jgi:hypothetical protein
MGPVLLALAYRVTLQGGPSCGLGGVGGPRGGEGAGGGDRGLVADKGGEGLGDGGSTYG